MCINKDTLKMPFTLYITLHRMIHAHGINCVMDSALSLRPCSITMIIMETMSTVSPDDLKTLGPNIHSWD